MEVLLLESPIDKSKIPVGVIDILSVLDRKGFETWLVGGCVRDLCLGLVPNDYDLASNARPEDIERLFEHSYATGIEHGTITVLSDDLAVEITTFRSDGSYSDARRPDKIVFQSNVEYDLARRDFTMNSMAWRPDRGLLDLHGGLLDLQQGLLRTVGKAEERFGEDALRMLRGMRFAVTYDLTPDPDLVEAATIHSDKLEKLSRERIVKELLSILAAPYPTQLLSFAGCRLLSIALKILMGIEAEDHLLCQTVSRLSSPDLTISQRLPVLLLAAAPDRSAEGYIAYLTPWFRRAAGRALQHLLMHDCRISRSTAQSGEAMTYLFWLRLHLEISTSLELTAQRCLLRLTARRYHFAQDALPEIAAAATDLLRLFVGGNADGQFSFSREALFAAPLSVKKLALNGRHLQKAGWKPGPPMSKLLERLLSFVMSDPLLNRPSDLMAIAIQIDSSRSKQAADETNLSCFPKSDL